MAEKDFSIIRPDYSLTPCNCTAIDYQLKFPTIKYSAVPDFAITSPESLQVGGSWTDWANRSWFSLREAMFADGRWPYVMPKTSQLPVFDGMLLYSRPNLHALVDPMHPETVYLKNYVNKIYAKVIFDSTGNNGPILFIERPS